MEKICDHRGKDLVPVKLDTHTWVLLPKEMATKQGIEDYKKRAARARELALRHYYGG